ncbi:MAG: DUF1016 N-terminal domain-containing protein [Verrucomicrobiota bacterium]
MTPNESNSAIAKSTPPVLTGDDGYLAFIRDVKQRIQSSQIKAATRINQELLLLYWDLGEQIVEKQRRANWGDGFLEQMGKDLRAEFPEMKGFSRRNLYAMRQWFLFWEPIWRQPVAKTGSGEIAQQLVAQSEPMEFVKQLASQIPWWHNIVIIQKTDTHTEALFYVRKTIENHWSRAVLTHQIESGLYRRDGKAINNFEATLPAPQSDLAREVLKDPYCFDFLEHCQPWIAGCMLPWTRVARNSVSSSRTHRALPDIAKQNFALHQPLVRQNKADVVPAGMGTIKQTGILTGRIRPVWIEGGNQPF